MRLLILFSLLSSAFAASLLAIDYGTDSFKASLVKPGIPFDVLINKDSKRKTQSMVTLRGDDRSFGAEAASLSTRFPQDTFSSIKLLLSSSQGSAQAQLHQNLFSQTPSTTSRLSPSLHTSKSSYPIEELLAMQFTYAKEMADELAKEPVREVIVTVPSWFRQEERQTILDAIELAGLRNIGLVNDGTAAAVNYAMSRSFPETPSYHLLYDLGAGSLRTTLVSLRSALLPDPLSLSAKPELKNVTSLTVHGTGYDLNVGGYVFDSIVRDIMQKEFEEKNGVKIGDDKRAMAKLLKEAARIKQVLSANSESSARVEGLYNDIDFRTVITREQLESSAVQLFPNFVRPIGNAFIGTNISLSEIESVIMIGGSSRVPMIETAVKSVVGDSKIAKNVNADEAAVLGAALYGAGLTRSFRTKDIRVNDITPLGIDVTYQADKATTESEARIINTHLFPALSKIGAKKTLTIKKTSDFGLQFGYRDQSNMLFESQITGVESAISKANLSEEAKANVTVKVTVELDESSMIGVTRAVLHLGEEQVAAKNETKSLTDKLKNLLGKKGSEDKAEKGDSTDESIAQLEELLKSANETTVPVPKTVRLDIKSVGGKGMSAEDKVESRKRLREIKAYETKKLAREEARNSLEAYVYKVRDLLQDDNFVGASVEDERRVIGDLVEKAGNWIWEEGESADTSELKKKKSEIEKLVKHVTARTAEAKERPRVIDAFKAVLNAAEQFLKHARTDAEKEKFTTEELSALDKLKDEAKDWFSGLLKKQDSLKAYEDPVLRAKDVEKKARDIDSEVSKLSKRKPKRKPKVVKPKGEQTEAEKVPEEEKPDEASHKKEHVADEL